MPTLKQNEIEEQIMKGKTVISKTLEWIAKIHDTKKRGEMKEKSLQTWNKNSHFFKEDHLIIMGS